MFSSKCCQTRRHLHAFLMVLPSRSAHIHPSVYPHCECCPVSPISFPKLLCVFCSFQVSFFPTVVYSGHLVALTSYVRCLGFIVTFLSSVAFAEWQQFWNAPCAVDSFNTQYCSCKTVTFHRATATVLSLGVRLWNSKFAVFGSSRLSSVFMISWLDNVELHNRHCTKSDVIYAFMHEKTK